MIWVDIDGYEEFYQVNELGEVRSKERYISNGKGVFLKEGSVLKQSKTTTGYSKVELTKNKKKKSFKVHRLVAKAFIKNPDNKPFVNHIDSNPLNNNVKNLEWCTQSENMKHAYRTLSKESPLHLYKDKLIKEYTENEKTSIRELCDKYGCGHSSLKQMLIESGVKIKTTSQIRNVYNINKEAFAKDIERGLSNKDLSKKYNANAGLIAVYKYKHKKGELIK